MKVLGKGNIETLLNRLAEQADVFVPMQRGPQTGFFSWKTYDEDHDDLMLDILNVYIPPKNIVVPSTARMNEDNNENCEARIIFGIRGCDVQGIDLLDEVFLSKGFENQYYQDRRNKTTIIANACYYPGPSCLCTSLGVNPTSPALADIVIHDVGRDGYVWENKTEKGRLITDTIADLLEEKEAALPEVPRLNRKVDFKGVAARLRDMVDHPLWEKYSEPCQTCAICTYTCPTCYCFDLQVKVWGNEGYDFSCYHSCMYREHSLINSMQNPRAAARERFRKRFLHKLQFFPERYGKPLCTGCGRCMVLCPAGAGIDKVITEVMETGS